MTTLPSSAERIPAAAPSYTAASDRLARLLDVLPDAVLCLDRQWHITYANAEAIRISRLDPSLFEQKTFWETFPDLDEETIRQYRDCMESGKSTVFELFYPRFDSHFHVRLIKTDEGLAAYHRDVTEEKRSSLGEATANERLAQAMEVTSDGVVVLARDWTVTFLNSNAKTILDPDDRLLGKNVWKEFPAARSSNFWDFYHRAMDEQIAGEFEAFYPEPLNLWFSIRARPSNDGIVVFFTNITARKQQEQALAASEERYRVLADLNPQAIWMGDPAGNITYANQVFLAYIGLDAVDLSGSGWLSGFHPEDRDRVVKVWTHSVCTGEDYDIEARIFRVPTQEYRHWRLRAAPVRAASGEILHWLGVGSDIHDEKTYTVALQAEKAETEKRNAEIEAIYQNTPVGLALFDPVEFRFLSLNEAEAEIIGLPKDKILGEKLSTIAPIPEVLELFHRVAQGESVRDHLIEGELPSMPGVRRAWKVNYLPLLAEDGSVRAILNSAIEITHQRRAEAALIQSEKLAAVGRLASSISHEINNPLEAITNLLYLIVNSPQLPEDLRVYVNMASAEVSRVSQIATQSLRFHRQSVARTRVCPSELVDAVLWLYTGRLANSGIQLDVRYSTDEKILCFENDIRQVLNNLIANAIDAMRHGGRLNVRAHLIKNDPQTEQSGVRITVADNGHGISANLLARIFEPFFTTKELNGTGLGLWISRGIVDRHHGRLHVRSSTDAVRHGSVFSLFLPCERENIV
jgi:PAS domain S-box-containing protein